MRNLKDALALAGATLAMATMLFAMMGLPGLLSDRDSTMADHPIVVVAGR